MALSDPQVETLATVAQSLPRIMSTPLKGKDGVETVYRKEDGSLTLTISHEHTRAGRVRTQTRVDLVKSYTDPASGQSSIKSLTFYNVTDRPDVGFTVTEVQNLVAAHQGWLTATIVAALYGGQS